jgi:hypothetical protein
MPAINVAINEFERRGVKVLAPRKGHVVEDVAGFKILDSDKGAGPLDVEQGFVRALFRASAGYLVNPGGYFGKTSATEIGLGMAKGLPIYSQEGLDMSDELHSPTAQYLISAIQPYSIKAVARMIKRNSLDTRNFPYYKPQPEKGSEKDFLDHARFILALQRLESDGAPPGFSMYSDGDWQSFDINQLKEKKIYITGYNQPGRLVEFS